jgi:hypothetical protein
MNVEKVEANILLKTLDDYKLVKQYLKENQIKVLGEYFTNSSTPVKTHLFCTINVMITVGDYQELAHLVDNVFSSVSIELVSSSLYTFNNSIKNLVIDTKNQINPEEKSKEYGTKMYWDKKLENIDKFINATNLFTLNAFKADPVIVDDYVRSEFLSYQDKIEDIDNMIKFFEGDPDKNKRLFHTQRYEDCAFLLEIKNKINKYYEGEY